jgi:hypothetical protein
MPQTYSNILHQPHPQPNSKLLRLPLGILVKIFLLLHHSEALINKHRLGMEECVSLALACRHLAIVADTNAFLYFYASKMVAQRYREIHQRLALLNRSWPRYWTCATCDSLKTDWYNLLQQRQELWYDLLAERNAWRRRVRAARTFIWPKAASAPIYSYPPESPGGRGGLGRLIRFVFQTEKPLFSDLVITIMY